MKKRNAYKGGGVGRKDTSIVESAHQQDLTIVNEASRKLQGTK